MPNGRCGRTNHTNRYPEMGALTCWRPTYEEYDRCIWHADVPSKPSDAFEEREPEAGERLDGAVFRNVSIPDQGWLRETILVEADFEKANLKGADLRDADLRATNFTDTHAKDATFERANLEDALFEGAKLQKTSFEDARLKDTKFSDTRIDHETAFGDVAVYEKEMEEESDAEKRRAQFDAATWIYRQIQQLSRRNALFANVEKYFHQEKNLRRRHAWDRRDYPTALRAEGSRILMGYGRNPWRVVLFSGLVILLSALLFPFLGSLRDTAPQEPVIYSLSFPPESSLGEAVAVLGQSLYFSVVAFSTLGYGDIVPVGAGARALAGLESLVGFGLVALLISVLLRRGNWL